MQHPVLYFFYLLYGVEAGVFLCLAPWSRLWLNSYFAHVPEIRDLLLSGYARGAVTAVGLLLLAAAARDFVSFRRSARRA